MTASSRPRLRLLLRWAPVPLTAAAAALLWLSLVQVEITGDHKGIYLLRGTAKPLELKDDLLLGDESRLIVSIYPDPFYALLRRLHGKPHIAPPFLEYDWDVETGRGYVISRLPGGRKLLASFSRFEDDRELVPSGLFLGGSLPTYRQESGAGTLDDTGMSYFDGRRWLHIWCSMNEVLAHGLYYTDRTTPAQWEYLGSRVIRGTPREVIIASNHRAGLGQQTLRLEKLVRFEAGRTWFTLVTRISNEGRHPVSYNYIYGDEPWIGDFGNSRGDVGWVEGRTVPYEGPIDLSRYAYAGMADLGNGLIGEGSRFTGAASFIEWIGGIRPDMVYFSNKVGPLRPVEDRVPLFTETSRSIYLQWGPRRLPPGGSETYVLAMGMAPDKTPPGLPLKPPTSLDPSLLAFLR